MATAVLPTAVDPATTRYSASSRGSTRASMPAEVTVQVLQPDLEHRGPAVNVVVRQPGREQPVDELGHLLARQRRAGLDRRFAGEQAGDPLVLVHVGAAPARLRQIVQQAGQRALGIERVSERGYRGDRDRVAAEGLDLEPQASDQAAV